MKTAMMTAAAMFAAAVCGAAETTWTGNGSDKLTSNAANWSNAADLSDGSTTATFASGGSEALADGGLSLYGIKFSSTGPFTLGAAADSSAITLGSGGIATSGTGPYTLSVPLTIAADQTWTVGAGTVVSAPIAADSSSRYAVTKTGAGNLEFNKESSFPGDVAVLLGGLTLKGKNPVGTGSITVFKNCSLTLDGAILDNRIIADPQGTWGKDTRIYMPAGSGESCINGEVTVMYGNFYTTLGSSGDSETKLKFAGGFKCAGGIDKDGKEVPDGGYAYFSLNGPGASGSGCSVVEFSEPVQLKGRSLYVVPDIVNKDGFAGTFIFSAAGNIINSFGHEITGANFRLRQCRLLTLVDGAFNNTGMKLLCDYNMEWDLCGTAQSIGSIDSSYTLMENRRPRITNSSENEATLNFNQTADEVNHVIFVGNLNVVMSGTKTFTVQSEMTATGSLTVKGGVMAFSKDGSWLNAPTVTVSGSGKITAAAGDTFSQAATLSLESADSFVLAAGEGGAVVTQTVSHLYIGGERKSHGCYTAGEGVLNVLYDTGVEYADGTLTVAAGEKLALDPYTQYKFNTIVIGEGAELEIPNPLCVDVNADYSITIGADAVLKLAPGVALRAGSVEYAGNVVSSGRYENMPWLQGGGGVYIPAAEETVGVEVKWTGQGGDTLMTTAGNWEDEVNPANGSLHAVFALGGTVATVPGEVYLNAMTFNTGSDFTVDGVDDDASIRLGSGGVATSGGADRTYTVSVPVKVETDQRWDINAPLYAVVSSDPLSRNLLVKSGTNALHILDGGKFNGSIDVAEGGIVVHGQNALGEVGQITLANTCGLTAAGCDIGKPVSFAGAPAGDWNSLTHYTVWGDRGDVLQKGKVTFGQGNFYVKMYCNQNYQSTLIFSGGFESDIGFPYFQLSGGGADGTGFATVVFADKPVSIARSFSLMPQSPNRDGISARICFSAANNRMIQLGHDTYSLRCCQIWTTVDWAFDNPSMKVVCDYDSSWDLQGTRQRVGHLDARHAKNRAPVITNSFDRPATLYLNQTADTAPRAVFGGNLSVDISGGKTTTIDHAMTASGEVTVNGGTLAFTAGGSWRKASAVSVNGNAKLTLAAAGNLGSKTRLILASESSLEIAAGVSLRVASLSVAGQERPFGCYRFGEGELIVGPPGLVVIIK